MPDRRRAARRPASSWRRARAGAVAEALAKLGVERDRIRAEARRAAFARPGEAVPLARSVTVVVLP